MQPLRYITIVLLLSAPIAFAAPSSKRQKTPRIVGVWVSNAFDSVASSIELKPDHRFAWYRRAGKRMLKAEGRYESETITMEQTIDGLLVAPIPPAISGVLRFHFDDRVQITAFWMLRVANGVLTIEPHPSKVAKALPHTIKLWKRGRKTNY